MAGAQSSLVLFPRFTTLIGIGDFAGSALDTSRFGSAQFELWRGPLLGMADGAKLRVYKEESLDGVTWFPSAADNRGYDPGSGKSVVLSQAFGMKWFRLRAKLELTTGTRVGVTLWAEGVLRG